MAISYGKVCFHKISCRFDSCGLLNQFELCTNIPVTQERELRCKGLASEYFGEKKNEADSVGEETNTDQQFPSRRSCVAFEDIFCGVLWICMCFPKPDHSGLFFSLPWPPFNKPLWEYIQMSVALHVRLDVRWLATRWRHLSFNFITPRGIYIANGPEAAEPRCVFLSSHAGSLNCYGSQDQPVRHTSPLLTDTVTTQHCLRGF